MMLLVLFAFAFAFLLPAFDIMAWFLSNKRAALAFNIVFLLMLAGTSIEIYISGISSSYYNLISVSPFSAFFAMLFSAGMLLVSLIAYSYSKDYLEFSILAGFALLGMLAVSFASSLLMILVGLELASLPSVFIVLLSRRNSLEAATKYLIMSAFVIAFLAFALVLLFGSSNSLSLSGTGKSLFSLLALIFFFASLGFDSAQFPFGVLLPDIYQGSGAYATAMLGGVNKKLGFAALIQVLILVFVSFRSAFIIAAILATLTMFYGNISALMQKNLKRLFAYSSISQAGYIMIGIATATVGGLAASLVQIFAHMFLFIGVLAVIAWLESKGREDLDGLIGLNNENKIAAISMTMFMLSMVGLPFTTGFVGKFLLFLNATLSGLVWLAILGIINSVISIFYYAKAITAIFTNKYEARRASMGYATFAVVVACLAITLLLGIYPSPLIGFATSAARALMH